MARPSNSDDRRQQIVQGLMMAMANHGYDKASINSIANAAGLSPGLIHYDCSNELEILLAITERLSAQLRRRFQQGAELASTASERLEAFLDAALALGKDSSTSSVAVWVLIGAQAVTNNDVRQAYQAVITQQLNTLQKLVQETAQEAGHTVANERAQHLATFAIASIEGAYQLASTVPQTANGQAASTLKAALQGLLRAC